MVIRHISEKRLKRKIGIKLPLLPKKKKSSKHWHSTWYWLLFDFPILTFHFSFSSTRGHCKFFDEDRLWESGRPHSRLVIDFSVFCSCFFTDHFQLVSKRSIQPKKEFKCGDASPFFWLQKLSWKFVCLDWRNWLIRNLTDERNNGVEVLPMKLSVWTTSWAGYVTVFWMWKGSYWSCHCWISCGTRIRTV